MQYRLFIFVIIAALSSPASSLAQSILHDTRVAQFKTAKHSKKQVRPKSNRRRTKKSIPKRNTMDAIQEQNDNAIQIHSADSIILPLRNVVDMDVNDFPTIESLSLGRKVSTATDSSLHLSIGFQNINDKTNNFLKSNAMAEKQLDVLNAVGSRTEGTFTIGDFSFTGMREREEHPLLLTTQRPEMTTIYNNKHLTLTAGLNVNRYYAIGITTQYGVHGAFTYNFSSQFSVTAFGEYYNFTPWYYMASFPYVSTRHYGGYITYRNNKFGTHIGAEKYYDPFVRQWIFRPIVTPFVKISNKFILELPIGGLLKEGSDRIFHHKRRNGPTIMPNL